MRLNPFIPTVPIFAVRETHVSRHNGGTSGAPLKPLRDDSALRAKVGCENATVGKNGLTHAVSGRTMLGAGVIAVEVAPVVHARQDAPHSDSSAPSPVR